MIERAGGVLGQAMPDFASSAAGRHGAPHGTLDLVLVAGAVVVVAMVFALGVKYLVRPGETAPDHIKRRILR